MTDLYIGIDFSLRNTGITIFNEKGEYTHESVKPTLTGVERLNYLTERFTDLLRNTPNLKGAAVEEYAFAAGGQLASIGEGCGTLRLALYKQRIPFVTVAPGTLKKYITGNGGASKDVIIKEVYKRFGIDTNDDNIADSVGLARLAYHHFTSDVEGLTKKQIEAVKAVNLQFEPRRRKPRK